MGVKKWESVGLKVGKCRERDGLIGLFIGVWVKVIEDIREDGYKREGEFRGKKGEYEGKKRGKRKGRGRKGG